MDLGIKDHVAIVTGAGNGIGAACARALAREHSCVAVADTNIEAAESVAAAILAAGGAARAFSMDVTTPESVKAAVAAIEAHWGRIDILVNNAGFSRDGAIEAMTDQQWSDVLTVNLTGQFNCIRETVPHMTKRGYGRIVNMASRAHFGDPNKSNYCASKAGVIGLTKALALEFGSRGLTVNAVAPGVIKTSRLLNLPTFPEIEERSIAKMPIKRFGEPEEVADAVLFFASVNAGFITGEVLHISGGRYG